MKHALPLLALPLVAAALLRGVGEFFMLQFWRMRDRRRAR
jgi:hypothetical protein